MKSILNVTVGHAEKNPWGIYIPVMLQASIDIDADEEETLPHVEGVWMSVTISHESMQSVDQIGETIDDCLAEYVGDWSAVGLAMVKSTIMKSIENNNVMGLSKDWFADPESATRH